MFLLIYNIYIFNKCIIFQLNITHFASHEWKTEEWFFFFKSCKSIKIPDPIFQTYLQISNTYERPFLMANVQILCFPVVEVIFMEFWIFVKIWMTMYTCILANKPCKKNIFLLHKQIRNMQSHISHWNILAQPWNMSLTCFLLLHDKLRIIWLISNIYIFLQQFS